LSQTPALVLVGGFLGAGKTSLILAASRVLLEQGKRAAVILNDQGDELVDTELADRHGILTGQVTGGCFCCRFSELVEAAERLREFDPDVIFAEAVGSCTDIAATIIRPLLRDQGRSFQVAPFTVVVDPRARYDDPELRFLFDQQIAEADLVVESKSDLGPGARERRSLSAVTGEGVAEWLDEVLGGELTAGAHPIAVDYERYARAEASLSWLNCRVAAQCTTPLSPAMLVGPFLDRLDAALSAAGVRIIHLKLMDQAVTGYIKAASCGNGQEPSVEGMLDASPARNHEILLNLRAAGDPEVLRRVVEREFAAVPARLEWRGMQSFRPAAPKPQNPTGAELLRRAESLPPPRPR
jgi:hypothetical protein